MFPQANNRRASELRRLFTDALLIVLTAVVVVSAVVSYRQQSRFSLPDDGVVWMERQGAVEALHVSPSGPGAKAGIRPGDKVRQISGIPIRSATDVTRVLVRLGSWSSAKYVLEREGIGFQTSVYVGEAPRNPVLPYFYVVALAYLAIGLFVFFRRGQADMARLFYSLCLSSFLVFAFHYTGKLNNFDRFIYWGNVAGGLLAPTIFLHFCWVFPGAAQKAHRGWRLWWLYIPAALLMALFVALATGMVRVAIPAIELRWLLDRIWVSFLVVLYLAGAVVLALRQRGVGDPVVRGQLKWLRNGVLFGVLPFGLFYALPYSLGAIPGPYMKLSVLTLVLLPLSWAYAVFRYRLMDVDVIYQQGYAYTLATLAVLGLVYGVVFSLGQFQELTITQAFLLILIAAFVFQPLRSWIQIQLDRYYFYKDRYDYRRTLLEFARELGSEVDLSRMLASVGERLMRDLRVSRVAFFLADEAGSKFRLEAGFGDEAGQGWPPRTEELDLSFLPTAGEQPYLFFERTRHWTDVRTLSWPASVRQSISELGLTYYFPCRVRGRTIAYLGVSRTREGDFLPSEDVELLSTLAGYVGIAIENARLYGSLQKKVEEIQRLREFNENIVESISVGIVAADFEDRVESWNNQMERLLGIPREQALGKQLCELLPADLMEALEGINEDTAVHHVYKYVLKANWKLGSCREGATPVVVEMPSGRSGGGEEPGERILNVAVAPLITRDHRRIGRLILFDDVTLSEQLERKLREAEKLSSIGVLAAGVAHEVNTPLAVISTYAQMLAKQLAGDEQKAALLEKIARQTFRASEIVNSLLNFSRTSPRQFTEVDLARVIRETLTLLEHQLSEAKIEVHLELEEPLPPIRGNFGQLQQVFLNLFLNARDAMQDGGQLTVRAWANSHSVQAEVSDTGPGIPPEHLSRIYDPFFTTKMGHKGTGLGLSITYGIVRDHGGAIDVESRPGQGACFRLTFPVLKKAVNA